MSNNQQNKHSILTACTDALLEKIRSHQELLNDDYFEVFLRTRYEEELKTLRNILETIEHTPSDIVVYRMQREGHAESVFLHHHCFKTTFSYKVGATSIRLISNQAPLLSSLEGKKAGDCFTYNDIRWEVLEVE